MTVVTVTQKTQNDMTSWSFAVEQEREQMLVKVTVDANSTGRLDCCRCCVVISFSCPVHRWSEGDLLCLAERGLLG